MKNLAQLKIGENILITEVVDHPLKTRLLEMGFRKGKEVKLIRVAPFGDPLLVELSGYRLMIRKKEAQLIKFSSSHE